MAKQAGIIKIKGTLDDLTFLKTEDGYEVRTKGGVSKQRILNDPNFVRTRENMAEFAHCATTGKLFRKAAANIIKKVKDRRVTGRLTGVLAKIKNLDSTSARGERKVFIGLGDPASLSILKGFEFNSRSTLATTLSCDWELDTATGEVVLPNFVPEEHLTPPMYATHITVSSAFMTHDFETGAYEVYTSNQQNLPIDLTATTVTLTPSDVPSGSGVALYFLLVEFFQEINAVQYPLKNGSFNALAIIEAL